ncbi:MAG: hypothetical protein M0R51_17025 [Clostridia bacterium]|jgi:hypothetical protein|nr:hypothetical protein [Clostridia bacterium]
MKIFSKDNFYKKVIGENYKYGLSEKEKKDKYSQIGFVIYFEDYVFSCQIRREPYWECDCQICKKYYETLKYKYIAPDLHIDMRKERLNSTHKLYKYLENVYKKI